MTVHFQDTILTIYCMLWLHCIVGQLLDLMVTDLRKLKTIQTESDFHSLFN